MFLGGHTCVPVSCNMWRNTFYIPHMNNWPEQVETLNSCQGTLVNSSHTKTFTIWNLEIQKTETVAIWTSRNLDMWKSNNLKCGIPIIWNAEIQEPVTQTTLRDRKKKTNPPTYVSRNSCHVISFKHTIIWNLEIPCQTLLVPFVYMTNFFGPMDYHVQLVWSHIFDILMFGPICFHVYVLAPHVSIHVQLVGLIFSHAQFVSSMFPRPTCWSHMLPCPICWSHIRPCPICLVP